MAKLTVESDDFTLEFDTPNFKKVFGKAKSNIPLASLHSFYSVEGCEASVTLNATGDLVQPPDAYVETILPKGNRSRNDGHSFFYDNVEYNVWLELKAHCWNAQIRHTTKIVEKELSSRNGGKILYGAIDMANDVGRRDFAFSYDCTVDGKTTPRQFVFTAEVLSQKLDYHKDWRTLVEEIEDRYPMLAYDFLKRTYHAFEKSYEENDAANLVWWNLFDRLQRPFVKACRLVINRPKRRLRGNYEYLRADQLTMLSARTENEFTEFASNPSHLYRVEKTADTHDTLENRFVKFALRGIFKKYVKLHKAILERDKRRDQQKLSDTAKGSMAAMERELKQLTVNPFFRRIGPFAGLRQLSLALQRAPGYSVIYRTFAILNAAYMIHEGMNKMETKDIADLYEIWCFLKVEEFTADALPAGSIKNPSGINGDDFVKLLSTGLRSTVVFRSSTGVELARVVYNPRISESASTSSSGIDGTVTPTSISKKSSQDPDIVLRLTNNDINGYQVTYLFDAKYRLEDIADSHAGAPPQDAIDQMHRYRDAIYYADSPATGSLDPFAYKKEVVGGYVLFPGKGKVEVDPPESGKDNRPTYIKSIDKVNIGALPLRPNDRNNADVLKGFISRLVKGNDSLEAVLEGVNPQKGAWIPVATPRAIVEAAVYGTYHGKEQLKWISRKDSANPELQRFYNLPFDAAKTLGISPSNADKKKLLALLPPGRNPTEELLVFRIKRFDGVRTDVELRGLPYQYPTSLKCHHKRYLVWELEKDDPITKRVANVKIASGGQTGVDRGAMEAAVTLGLEFRGWAPHGWIAEDGTIPEQYREKMQEHPEMGGEAQNYRERTKANVRDSHATLILVDSLPLSGGVKLTEDTAVAMMKSHKVIVMSAANAKYEALKWLRQFLGMSSALVLNVAGPRESEAPGVQVRAKAFLEELLWEV